MVSILFIIFSLIGFLLSGLSVRLVAGDLVERLGRNLFLVLSLLLPILAGMGINFALVIGAMTGQIALIVMVACNIGGMTGICFAMLLSLPISIICGILAGIVLNKAKGNEMIVSLMLGYLASGLYQIICLSIPVYNTAVAVEGGIGIKSTIDLKIVRYTLDRFPFDFRIAGIKIPLLPLLLCFLLAGFIIFLQNTKLGCHMKAVGFDSNTAELSGIAVNKLRITAMIGSTVFAAWGQIISLQNIGTMSTFGSHEQVSIYSAAALLAGGATIKRATVKNAVFGTILFYLLFIIAPKAGSQLFADAQIGEFFRVFISYGIIVLALFLSYNNQKEQKIDRQK